MNDGMYCIEELVGNEVRLIGWSRTITDAKIKSISDSGLRFVTFVAIRP